jgi:hypothetical protein
MYKNLPISAVWPASAGLCSVTLGIAEEADNKKIW